MADVKISGLPAASAAAAANEFEINEAGTSKKVTGTQVKAFASADSLPLTGGTLTGNLTVPSINSGPLAGFRNAIINGNFDFWQRGTSYSNPTSDVYTSDRWKIIFDGTGTTRTISRQVFTLGQTDVPGEPTAFYRFNQSVAGSGGTFNVIAHKIEGVRTFAGQQVTLSFFARGAASLTLPVITLHQSFGTGGSPSADVYTDFGFSTVVGTTFTRFTFTVTVPSISGKTLGANNNDNLELLLFLPINTTFTFDLASVQIELGPVATPFERRPVGTELALCQRYFETGASILLAAYSGGNFGGGLVVLYFNPKRVSPSIVATVGTGDGNITALNISAISDSTVQGHWNGNATQGDYRHFTYTLSAEL